MRALGMQGGLTMRTILRITERVLIMALAVIRYRHV